MLRTETKKASQKCEIQSHVRLVPFMSAEAQTQMYFESLELPSSSSLSPSSSCCTIIIPHHHSLTPLFLASSKILSFPPLFPSPSPLDPPSPCLFQTRAEILKSQVTGRLHLHPADVTSESDVANLFAKVTAFSKSNVAERTLEMLRITPQPHRSVPRSFHKSTLYTYIHTCIHACMYTHLEAQARDKMHAL